MRSGVSALALLTALAACGSDEGVRDTVAPTVTLSAPTTTPIGGQTVVISVTATDDIDPSVSPVLSCTGGGTLTGNSLALPNVTADTTITCTATATDKAGNAGTGSITLNVKAANATAALASGSQSVNAGGSGLIYVDNITLSQASYDATLGGMPVKVARAGGNALMFTTPLSLGTGTQRLKLSVEGRAYEFDVQVGAPITVADPRGAVVALMNEGKALIAARLQSTTLTAAERGTLEGNASKIDQAIANLAQVSDSDLGKLASYLAANGGIIASGQTAQDYVPIVLGENCVPAIKSFGRGVALTYIGFQLTSGSISIATAIAEAAPIAVIPAIVTGGLGVALGAHLMYDGATAVLRGFPAIKKACFKETQLQLLSFLDNAGAAGQRAMADTVAIADKQAFRNKTARTFQLSRSFAPKDDFATELNHLFSDLSSGVVTSILVPADLRAQVGALKNAGSEIVPIANVSVGGVSRSDISISAESLPSKDAIRLTATYTGTTPPTDNIDFTFVVSRAGESAGMVSAQLAVKLPEADDLSTEAVQDTAVTARVQARNADSLEIVGQPANGRVTLSSDGTFQYTPNSHYFGTDSFTYRARNVEGVSRTATVNVSVIRRFEGSWNIVTESKTTAASSQGLCPDETKSFTLLVSKISDTQYTANYAGYDITLSMASKDDPAGVSGARTVTYDDAPGTTTETVTASIPDSRRLFGTSFFEYTGPNGTFCRGNVKITGTR